MIRRGTWFLLFILVIVIGAAYYLNTHKNLLAGSSTPTPGTGGLTESVSLFPSSVGVVTDIIVKDTTGKTVEVARNDSETWVLKAPTNAPADQASAEAAATQVGALRVLSSVQLDLAVVGLDKPTYIMSFMFKNGSKHTLNVGSETPIQDGYYTSLDNGPIKIVDKAGIDALTKLLTEPPYVATPTAPVTDTPEIPTPQATSTPLLAPTDTPGASAGPTLTATP